MVVMGELGIRVLDEGWDTVEWVFVIMGRLKDLRDLKQVLVLSCLRSLVNCPRMVRARM